MHGPKHTDCDRLQQLTDSTVGDGEVKLNIALLRTVWDLLDQGTHSMTSNTRDRQDTGYMVEKTYLDITTYLGAFGAYLLPQ